MQLLLLLLALLVLKVEKKWCLLPPLCAGCCENRGCCSPDDALAMRCNVVLPVLFLSGVQSAAMLCCVESGSSVCRCWGECGNVGWCAGVSERLGGVWKKRASSSRGSRSEKGSPQPWQALKKHEKKMNVLLKDISWKMFVDILGFESSGRTVELKKTYL